MVAAASKGIGRACARALAAEGCKVSICARTDADVASAAAEIGALGVAADVGEPADLERWASETEAKLGPPEILVTNTGGPPVARLLDSTEEQWRAGFDATLMNVVRLVKRLAPGMRARGWGRIIHLTSFVARQPAPELTISSTLRAGISAMTRTLAAELGPDGITVNAVLMGHVMTARQEHLLEVRMKERGLSRDEAIARSVAEVPLRRMGEAKEIGDVVAFLASERASYLTGASISVDGGLTKATF
jgi:3-oxoacyl-[acyl-carrier protein] reductase